MAGFTTPVFPNSHSDPEQGIFKFLASDPCSLVRLSCVNRAAWTVLSEFYFEQLFIAQYPLLAKTEELFSYCRTYNCDDFPAYRWKFSCWMMGTENPAFGPEFLQKTASSLKGHLISQKAALESKRCEIKKELQHVYGLGGEDPDPDSLLGEAREAQQQSCFNLENMCRSSGIDPEESAILTELDNEIDSILEPIVDMINDPFIGAVRASPGMSFQTAKRIFGTLLLHKDLHRALLEAKAGRNVLFREVFENHWYMKLLTWSFDPDYLTSVNLSDVFDLNCIDNYSQVALALEQRLKRGGLPVAFMENMRCDLAVRDLGTRHSICSKELRDCENELTSVCCQLEDVDRYNQFFLHINVCFAKHHKILFYSGEFEVLREILNRLWSSEMSEGGPDRLWNFEAPEGGLARLWSFEVPPREGVLSWGWGPRIGIIKTGNLFFNSYASVCDQDEHFNQSMHIGLDQNLKSIEEYCTPLNELQEKLRGEKQTLLGNLELIELCEPLGSHIPRILLPSAYYGKDGSWTNWNLTFPTAKLLSRVSALIAATARRSTEELLSAHAALGEKISESENK